MRSPNHLHSTSGLLAAIVTVLVVGVGVVQAQQPDAPSIDPEAIARIEALVTTLPSAPTTTTTAPAPTTTVAPVEVTAPPVTTAPPTTARPAPPTTAAPAPAPAPAPSSDPQTYAMDLIRQVVPGPWLAAVPVRVEVISGKTSWSSWGGLIQVGDWQLLSSVSRAKNTLAHEWGHQLAWHYGTDITNGAPVAGFPYGGRNPEEMWADCVAEALTGVVNPTGGLPACPSEALSFTRSFLNAGPGTPLR